MSRLGILRKVAWMPLAMAPLLGCFNQEEIINEGFEFKMIGFVSDTTAMIVRTSWQEIEWSCGFGTCSTEETTDWKLQLVDVRFHKIYWESKVKDGENGAHGDIYYTGHWSDSTMFIKSGRDFLLWTIGRYKPQKISFNWNVDEEGYRTTIMGFRLRPWRDESILILSAIPRKVNHAVIDTKAKTVDSWALTDENKWIMNWDDIWWGKNIEGGGLIIARSSCNLFTLSENGDTLGTFAYPHECEGFEILSVNRHFIELSPFDFNNKCSGPYYSYNKSAVFRYNDKGNIAQEPSFWRCNLNFIDSLGNVVDGY